MTFLEIRKMGVKRNMNILFDQDLLVECQEEDIHLYDETRNLKIEEEMTKIHLLKQR
jgi:hypothetical protein